MDETSNLSDEEVIKRFELTQRWFDLGIFDDEWMKTAIAAYRTSGDTNSEHYRYGAFCNYLKKYRQLTSEQCWNLFELGATDADQAMGTSIIIDIMQRPECPNELFDAAAGNPNARVYVAEMRHRHHFENDVPGYRNQLKSLGPTEYLRRFTCDSRGKPRPNHRLFDEMGLLFGMSPMEVKEAKRTARLNE